MPNCTCHPTVVTEEKRTRVVHEEHCMATCGCSFMARCERHEDMMRAMSRRFESRRQEEQAQ
jgi:hypothetical protein